MLTFLIIQFHFDNHTLHVHVVVAPMHTAILIVLPKVKIGTSE